MKKGTLIICIFLLAFVAMGAKECESKRIHNALDREAGIPKHDANFKYSYRSPGGVQVASTVQVPSDALPLLDEGITNQITRHSGAHPEWVNYRNLSDYKVLFVEPSGVTVETDPGAPLIHVRGVSSAGTTIGTTEYSSCRPNLYIVLPHQAAQGWSHRDYLMRSAWHESEHIREWENNRNVFYQFANAGDVHPHIP
jgi:hypothetical protein